MGDRSVISIGLQIIWEFRFSKFGLSGRYLYVPMRTDMRFRINDQSMLCAHSTSLEPIRHQGSISLLHDGGYSFMQRVSPIPGGLTFQQLFQQHQPQMWNAPQIWLSLRIWPHSHQILPLPQYNPSPEDLTPPPNLTLSSKSNPLSLLDMTHPQELNLISDVMHSFFRTFSKEHRIWCHTNEKKQKQQQQKKQFSRGPPASSFMFTFNLPVHFAATQANVGAYWSTNFQQAVSQERGFASICTATFEATPCIFATTNRGAKKFTFKLITKWFFIVVYHQL